MQQPGSYNCSPIQIKIKEPSVRRLFVYQITCSSLIHKETDFRINAVTLNFTVLHVNSVIFDTHRFHIEYGF